MATSSDPYALLGVSRGATPSQIKAAHRALAKRYHPDAPTADAKLFLRVQEAYQLLTDPLRRREWDARHAPMRADQPAPPSARGRRSTGAAASGGSSGPAAERRRARTEPPRDQPSRSYTWSAGEVPWWEDGARETRRSGRGARRAAGAGPAAGAERSAQAEPPPAAETAPQRNEFDVYSRSSGAAWSSAARAYFRRADQDLPRRGSFHHQGSQPLTAARARAAAEQAAKAGASASAAAAASEPASAPHRPSTTSSSPGDAPGRSPLGGQPAYAYAGVAHDAEQITAVRQMARERRRAAEWPSLGQRARFALLAWLPLALLIGYGAPHALGCGETGSCPPTMAAGQALTASAALALLLALPRLAFVLAVASAGVIVAGGTALLGSWLLGVRAPQAAALPGWAIAGGAIVLLAAYLVTATWLLTDRRRLPWVGPPGGRR